MNPTKTKYARERAAQIKEVQKERVRQEKKYSDIQEKVNYNEAYADVKQLRKDVKSVIEKFDWNKHISEWRYIAKYSYRNDSESTPTHEGVSFEQQIISALNDMTLSDSEQAERKRLRKELEKRLANIERTHNNCMDIVVLGDEATALAELNAFAETEF